MIAPRGDLLSRTSAGEDAASLPAHENGQPLVDLVEPLGAYDHVSIGFPGYVRDGKVFTAPHLGTKAWAGFDLAAAMRRNWEKPIKLLNDADVQGLAVIKGKGLELVCTLGTGFGTAWFRDGELMPHMDLAHMADPSAKTISTPISATRRAKIGTRTGTSG